LAGGSAKVNLAHWNDLRENLASESGWVGAVKTSCEGGFFHISVSAGAESLKGGMVVVVVALVILKGNEVVIVKWEKMKELYETRRGFEMCS
jgi:hypothetical protein